MKVARTGRFAFLVNCTDETSKIASTWEREVRRRHGRRCAAVPWSINGFSSGSAWPGVAVPQGHGLTLVIPDDVAEIWRPSTRALWRSTTRWRFLRDDHVQFPIPPKRQHYVLPIYCELQEALRFKDKSSLSSKIARSVSWHLVMNRTRTLCSFFYFYFFS